MSGAMLLYLLTISFLLMLAAFTAEWLLIRLRRPARWAWVAALFLCVVLPFLPAQPPPEPERSATDLNPVQVSTLATAVASDIPSRVTAAAWSVDLDVPQNWLILGSLLTGGSLLVGWALLLLRARRWPRADLDGTAVLRAPATGPAVVGFFAPRIVVPDWAFELPPAQRRMLLAHEQSHIDARDGLVLLLAGLVVVAMPWNPMLWFGLKRLRAAIEIDCDRRVLAGGEEAESYARCLVESVTLAAGGPAPVVAALFLSSSNLERRVDLMLRSSRPVKVLSAVAVVTVVALVTSAFMKAPPVPTATDVAYAKANAAALDLASKRTANYYERLTSGKLVSSAITYGVLYDNWMVIDKDKQGKGEGC